jgi:hypothetical protein
MAETFETKCSALVGNNGIVRFLLTVEPSKSQPEHGYFNLLRSRVDFEEGDIIKVTLEVVRRKE